MPDQDLPVSTVYQFDIVDEIIRAAAFAVSAQLAISSGWEEDDSWQSDFVWLVETINPISGAYNKLRHGEWSSVTSGSQKVSLNGERREALKRESYMIYWGHFRRCLNGDNGAEQAHLYLVELVNRTRYAWAAVHEQFEMARRINNDVNIYLNNAIDRAYAIRTAASVAFMVVGSLPALTAAAGATTVASFSYAAAGSFTLVASTQSAWVLALQVAGSAAVYGFFTELAFNKDDVRRSGAAAVHFGDGATGAAFGAGGNLAQSGLEEVRKLRAANAATEARMNTLREQVRNEVMRTRAAMRGGDAVTRMMAHEGTVRHSAALQHHAERNLSRVSQSVARSGSAIFILLGLYSMREDIRLAMDGLTNGLDRTR